MYVSDERTSLFLLNRTRSQKDHSYGIIKETRCALGDTIIEVFEHTPYGSVRIMLASFEDACGSSCMTNVIDSRKKHFSDNVFRLSFVL